MSIPGGWRNVPSQPQRTSFTGPRGLIDTSYYWLGAQIDDGGADEPLATSHGIEPDQTWLETAGVRYRFGITREAGSACPGHARNIRGALV